VYIILFGLAVINALDGIAAASGALSQLYLLLAGPPELTRLLTPLQCMMSFSNWMFAFTDTAQCLLLLVVSLDRLFSVSFPLRYYPFGRRYGYSLVCFVFMYSFASAVAAWIYPLAYSGPPFISALCVNRLAYGPFQTYLNVIRIAFAYTSVALYALVLIVYRRKVAKVTAPMCDARRALSDDRQRRLTTTLGLQSLSTLLLFILPMSLATSSYISLDWIIWLFIFSNGNAIANLFIYVWRLKEFRHALVSTICGFRQLPADMSLWFANGNFINDPLRRERALTQANSRAD
jgi:hypothetical protein